MERRFRVRLDELRDDAEIPPGLMRGIFPRLEAFLRPFVDALDSPQQRTNARHYVQGLLSDLTSKDIESIAYLHDRQRQGLQKFIGQADWDHRTLLTELARQVGAQLARIIQSPRRAASDREPPARGSGQFCRDRPCGNTAPLPPRGEGTATGCPEG